MFSLYPIGVKSRSIEARCVVPGRCRDSVAVAGLPNDIIPIGWIKALGGGVIATLQNYEYSGEDPRHRRWRQWCRDNAAKRQALVSRLERAIKVRDKVSQRELELQIKKIDKSRFR